MLILQWSSFTAKIKQVGTVEVVSSSSSRSHNNAATAIASDDPPLELLTRWSRLDMNGWNWFWGLLFSIVSLSQGSPWTSRQPWAGVRYLVKPAGGRHLPCRKSCQVVLKSFCETRIQWKYHFLNAGHFPDSAMPCGFFSLWLWGLYWRQSTRWAKAIPGHFSLLRTFSVSMQKHDYNNLTFPVLHWRVWCPPLPPPPPPAHGLRAPTLTITQVFHLLVLKKSQFDLAPSLFSSHVWPI